MRALRAVVVVALAASLSSSATPASADGGAFLQFHGTYYLAGETAVATAVLLIPKKDRDVLERGPFFAFVTPRNIPIREGRAIPDGAVRLGTLIVEARKRVTKLSLRFTMPDLANGNYAVQICNDPCTVSGVPTPLSGFFSIVHTARERRLLIEQQRLRGTIWTLKRKAKKADRASATVTDELDTVRGQRDALAGQVAQLRGQIATEDARPLVDPWVGAAAAIGLLVVAAAFARERRRRSPLFVEPSATPSHDPIEREPAGIR